MNAGKSKHGECSILDSMKVEPSESLIVDLSSGEGAHQKHKHKKTEPLSPRVVRIITGNEIPLDYIDKLGDEAEIIQEFSRSHYPECFSEQILHVEAEESSIISSIQLASLDELNQKIEGKSSLSIGDIPVLRERWLKRYHDILTGAPQHLPPFRGINHHIPIIDEKKNYNYYLPRCPDSLKPQLLDKIKRYVAAGWWEPITTSQAMPMLCIPRKNGKL